MDPEGLAQRLYPSRGARRRAVAGWCLYDFAVSSYTTLIITVAFSVYFRDVVVDAPGNAGDRWWGLANFSAMLLVAVTAPVLGAAADYSGAKKRLLIGVTVATVAGTAGLAAVGPGDLAAAFALYVVATFGFEAGYVFYNAFLPEISERSTIGRISGWAWGIGFLGGLAALVLCGPWISSTLIDAAGLPIPEAVRDRQVSFVLVAAFYLVFSLPAFFWLRETRLAQVPLDARNYLRVGVLRVTRTLRQLRRFRETGKFVLASLFFNDGITTTISFSAIYATTTFGLRPQELVLLFVVLNLVAFPGAVGAGYLADRFGARRTLIGTLVLWIGVVALGAAAWNRASFWAMACGAAIGMGSTQAVARSFMAQIAPPSREAEFFGFYVLSGKFASLFGPLIFGFVSAGTGSQRVAVLTLAPLFLAGLVLTALVDERAAVRAARADPT